jgi:hypothetical protein
MAIALKADWVSDFSAAGSIPDQRQYPEDSEQLLARVVSEIQSLK